MGQFSNKIKQACLDTELNCLAKQSFSSAIKQNVLWWGKCPISLLSNVAATSGMYSLSAGKEKWLMWLRGYFTVFNFTYFKFPGAHSSALAWSQTRLSDFTFPFHFHALEKAMATHSSVLAWRIPATGSLVGCRLWGLTESDMTEAT